MVKLVAQQVTLLTSLTALLLASHPAPALQFNLVDLGDLPGGVLISSATAINNAGQVVGNSLSPSLEDHAFLWENGTIRSIGRDLQPSDINDAGEIVGNSHADVEGLQAFHWRDDVLTLLPRLPGDGDNQAAAINAAGVIVGVSKRDPFRFAGTPVTWRDGAIQRLGGLPPSVSQDAVASGINALGDVVGSVATMADTHTDRAVLWRSGDEQATLLPALFALDISDRGEVAMMGFNNHAVVWRDGVLSDLGALPGMEMHVPTAINNQGWVVGFAHGGGQVRGFLWTPETGLKDLTELVLAPGRILHVWDVNDRGQIAATHQVGSEDRGVLLDLSAARPVSEPHVLLLLIVLLILWPRDVVGIRSSDSPVREANTKLKKYGLAGLIEERCMHSRKVSVTITYLGPGNDRTFP